jgi:hypothetical protein
MASMRFISYSSDSRVLPKIIRFDSSPGWAIARAMGNLDPNSYKSELKEQSAGEKVFEIKMRQAPTECNPGPHPLRKVGTIFWTEPKF